METKYIDVNGQVFRCPVEWTVEQTRNEIRSRYGLQYGGIEEDGVPVLGYQLISSLTGPLAFVGGQQLGATAAATPADKKQNVAFDQAGAHDSDGKWYHIPGLLSCEAYEQFSLILSRYFHHPFRPSKFYWIYNDKRPRLKISPDNYEQGLEDEQKGLCFIYVHYYEDSPVASLTVDNLRRHSLSYIAPVKLGTITASSRSTNVTENLSKNSKISRNSSTALICKRQESFICRCCHYQGESITTVAAHILEIKEVEAVNNKKVRKDYLLHNFGLDLINGLTNLICLCQVCHKYFDDQLLKLNPDLMIWEVNPSIQSERSGMYDMTYARLHGRKCENKVILNRKVLEHRYQRQSKEVNMDELASDLRRLNLL